MTRKLKIYEQSIGRNYKPVPTIILKGDWLKEIGFTSGEYVEITCEGDKITLIKSTPPEHKTSSKVALQEKIDGLSKSKRKKLYEMIDKL